MVWYNPLTWENPLKVSWGAPAETEEPNPAVDTAELAPAPAAETESEMPVGGRRRKHRKTKRSKKSKKSKKTGRKH
jgi:hypothetical protein